MHFKHMKLDFPEVIIELVFVPSASLHLLSEGKRTFLCLIFLSLTFFGLNIPLLS